MEEGLEPLFEFDLPPLVQQQQQQQQEEEARLVVINLEPYYQTKQQSVANLFNVPVSTFSKNWHKASNGRIWPYRKIKKIDAELATTKSQKKIKKLHSERNKLMRPVRMRIRVIKKDWQ
jgi:hypothetical protein